MNAALATLAVGDEVLAHWRRYCEPGWRRYAARHGLDIHLQTAPLDDSPRARGRSSSWQKCLLLGRELVGRYERVVWLDADVVVNPRAPSVVAQVPADRIGGVVSGSYVLDDLKVVLMERAHGRRYEDLSLSAWTEYQRAFYQLQGLEPVADFVVQCGVLVVSPSRHGELFAAAYRAEDPSEGRGYEQVALSHEILRRDLLTPLNSRFNTLFYERLLVHYPYLLDNTLAGYDELARRAVATEYDNSFFLHFAYDPTLARFLPAAALARA